MIKLLDTRLRRVAPITGVAIGDTVDKSTWRVDFADGATPEQRDAAAAVITSFNAVDAEREEYLARVDADAEAVRLRYITPGAGMALTYQEKFAQAQAVHAMGMDAANALNQTDREAQFPTLSASIGIEAPTLYDCANLVLTKYAAFAALSLVIERTRLAAKASIKSATTVQGVQAAYEAVAWPTP